MQALSPLALVGAAQSFVGFREEQSAGRGQMVDRFLAEMREAANGDWSAAFVHHTGFWSHYDWLEERSSWPLPPGNCRDLTRFARDRKACTDAPEFGDLFVQFSRARQEHVRAGIVLGVTGRGELFRTGDPFIECEVIEGNSTFEGALGGPAIVRVRRRLCLAEGGDCVIRWTGLDPRCAISNPSLRAKRAAGRTSLRSVA